MLSKVKTLGKISPDQFGRTLAIVDEIEAIGEIYDLLKNNPRFRKLVESPKVKFSWAIAYEFDYQIMVAALLWVVGDKDIVERLNKANDKNEEILLMAEEEQIVAPGRIKASKALWSIGLLKALMKSAECMSLYSTTMNSLVSRIGNGDHDALVKAVTVDPTVLAGPSGAHQLALAVMRQDKRLLRRISKAFGGPHKGRTPYRKLRYSALVLDEAGALAAGNREHVFDVVANQLQLYEQKNGDPFKGLFTQFSRWKAEATT